MQCARDWPRMVVHDNRTLFQRIWDFVLGNELLDYFGNQSTMAKPFELAMLAAANANTNNTPAGSHDRDPGKHTSLANFTNACTVCNSAVAVVVQCSRTPFSLTIHPVGARHALTLRKRLVVRCLPTEACTHQAKSRDTNDADDSCQPELVLEAVVRIASDTSQIAFKRVLPDRAHIELQ